MAKIQVSDLFTSVSGKLCSKEGTYISLNKQTGKMYSAVRHNYTNPNTEAQQVVKAAFTSRAKLGAAWWKANKPSDANPKGSEYYQLVLKAYKAQHKIGNPYNYLRTLVTDDLKVKLGDLDITGEIKADTPSSGTGSKPGGSQGSGGTQTPSGGTSQGAGGEDGKSEG